MKIKGYCEIKRTNRRHPMILGAEGPWGMRQLVIRCLKYDRTARGREEVIRKRPAYKQKRSGGWEEDPQGETQLITGTMTRAFYLKLLTTQTKSKSIFLQIILRKSSFSYIIATCSVITEISMTILVSISVWETLVITILFVLHINAILISFIFCYIRNNFYKYMRV